jgi:arginase family enzyme
VFDPEVGRANTYAEPNGLRVYELEEALSLINQQFEIVSIAFTAYDPAVDTDQRIFQAAMQLMTHVLKLIEQKAV